MSRFFSKTHANLTPYTPGEQPRDRRYVKLNTNESPFPPSKKAQMMAEEAAHNLELYPDPTCHALNASLAERYGIRADEVLVTNGSDEILNFAFMAFCDKDTPAVFPDITYGFYEVFAELYNVPHRKIPLREDFTVNVDDYCTDTATVFLANPNAPTGIALPLSDIIRILESNPNHVVVVDEAYVDFGGETCVPLIRQFDNLLVTQTFSKSRSMAGARLGMGMACPALIADLNAMKYATNPYNINRMSGAAGIGALADEAYTLDNCRRIMENRAYLSEELTKMGFVMTPSKANFIFARHPKIGGKEVYEALRERGILVRHFGARRISDYNRITVGTRGDMEFLVDALREILEEHNI